METQLEHDVRHIKAIEETDDSFIIEFGKSKPGEEEVSEEMEDSMEMDEEKEERNFWDKGVVKDPHQSRDITTRMKTIAESELLSHPRNPSSGPSVMRSFLMMRMPWIQVLSSPDELRS